MRRLIVQPQAQADERLILSRSLRVFGTRAARAYAALLRRAYKVLQKNPQTPGVQCREDLRGAPFLLHLRHARKRGQSPKQPRHFIVFTYDETTLTVLRVLQDSMDLPSHIEDDENKA